MIDLENVAKFLKTLKHLSLDDSSLAVFDKDENIKFLKPDGKIDEESLFQPNRMVFFDLTSKEEEYIVLDFENEQLSTKYFIFDLGPDNTEVVDLHKVFSLEIKKSKDLENLMDEASYILDDVFGSVAKRIKYKI